MLKKIQAKIGVSKEGEVSQVMELYNQPKKDKGNAVPHYKRGGAEPEQVYQADLMEMPNDRGYNYLLMVVDTITGKMGAQPLKGKTAEETLTGFKKIFAKGDLPIPKWSIQVDEGGEFKSVVKKYFDDNGVLVRIGKVDRSRHQALVEKRNAIIAKALFQKQVGQEIASGRVNKKWVEDVQEVVDAVNEYETENYNKRKKIEEKKKTPNLPYIPKNTVIFEVGTKVRVKFEKPRGVLGEKLSSGTSGTSQFRATDIKWEPTIRTITNIILTPNQPVMYQVDNKTPAYTFNQLQQVNDKEVAPVLNKKAPTQKAVAQATEQLHKAIPLVVKKVSEEFNLKPGTYPLAKKTRTRTVNAPKKFQDE